MSDPRDKFEIYIRDMVKYVRGLQTDPTFSFFFKHLDEKSLKKEFLTIHLRLPRSSGHTTIANKLFMDPNSVFIAPNKNLCPLECHGRTSDTRSISLKKFRGKQVDMIIVDCASLVSRKALDRIYDSFPLTK